MPRNVTPLTTASEGRKRSAGRPANLETPPIPQDLIDSMEEIEQQHFYHFLEAQRRLYKEVYGRPITPTADIYVIQAALDYVNLWRLQREQLADGKLLSQARQHPGVQLRNWLKAAGLEEADVVDRKPKVENEEGNLKTLLSLAQN